MFRTSQGHTTGIVKKGKSEVKDNYVANKYELLNNTVLNSAIGEYVGKNVSLSNNDASLECDRMGCKAWVRNAQDGMTQYYRITNPYAEDVLYKDPAWNDTPTVVVDVELPVGDCTAPPKEETVNETVLVKESFSIPQIDKVTKLDKIYIFLIVVALLLLLLTKKQQKEGAEANIWCVDMHQGFNINA